eukprot:TRINITY_DN1935_c0_g1_i1.p2 TRINITY_DN1935_c0_g1~~TRINITY_DN1935_c0_g1_i1.p2  ORF type:complete len:104 (-),score=3.56 TRINITY_DN1935_c0_g1_i1:107-418(-)
MPARASSTTTNAKGRECIATLMAMSARVSSTTTKQLSSLIALPQSPSKISKQKLGRLRVEATRPKRFGSWSVDIGWSFVRGLDGRAAKALVAVGLQLVPVPKR